MKMKNRKLSRAVLLLSVMLMMVLCMPVLVQAESRSFKVYYDAASQAVAQGNALYGKKFQMDDDLVKLAVQMAAERRMNGEKNGYDYSFKADSPRELSLMRQTDNLKGWHTFSFGYVYKRNETLEDAKERIISCIKHYSSDSENLIGVVIMDMPDWPGDNFDDSSYFYQIIFGKGTCKPAGKTGTVDETITYGVNPLQQKPASGGTSSGSSDKPKLTGLGIQGTSSSLVVGQKMKLTAKVYPADLADPKLSWSVNNSKYASVSANGVVKAKAAGAGKTVKVMLKAADGSGLKATYSIRLKGAVKKIKLTAGKSLKVGKTMKIKAAVTIGKGGSKALKWTSSNKKYATVSSKGVVKAKKAGRGKTVKITATAKDGSGKKAVVKIKIK